MSNNTRAKNNIYMPIHYDIGNRGCEGISKGTIKILSSYNIFLFTNNIKLDREIGKFGSCLIPSGKLSKKKNKICLFFMYLFEKNDYISKKFESIIEIPNFYKEIKKSDGGIILISGGDMFCYGHPYAVFLNRYVNSRKFKTVLWGCSFGKENVTKEKLKSLRKFDLITTRETITYNCLKELLAEKKIYCFPDSAFVLEAEEWDYRIPTNEQGLVGINLSDFVSGAIGSETIFENNISELIDYILSETKMMILMIPHVFWRGQDDRIICKKTYEKYKNTNRVYYFDYKVNYCQTRYVIGQCRFFIGARTHSMISAYTMYVPSLALGYSVKSKGIAKDLGLPDELVIDCNNLKSNSDIKNAFIYLIENETNVRTSLKNIMPNYVAKAYEAKDVIDKLLKEKEE